MKNQIRQMCRRPVQTLFIIFLIMIVTVMLTVGGSLWAASDRLEGAYEEEFMTIGTVTQKPDAIRTKGTWDAERQDYLLRKVSDYNRYAVPEDLAFPEAAYLTEPEKRVYWGSYVPEYVHVCDDWGDRNNYFVMAVEFSPKEDCVPSESVKLLVTKVLGEDKTMEGAVIWFCDHENPAPEELKADKTYAAVISETQWVHGRRWEESGNLYNSLEYTPQIAEPTLYTETGERIEDPLDMKGIYEVTEGFYETEPGKRILSMAEEAVVFNDIQPVVGTNNTDLMLPFYEGNAWVCEGRCPTQEEYAQGSAVCLASRTFAENNGLSVGDQVTTRLFYTNAGARPDRNFGTSGSSMNFHMIGSDGQRLKPFEEKAYTIVGLYDYTQLPEGIGADELIVPLASVKKPMENIVEFGAMADFNTSFQIPNGSIPAFLEASAAQGADNLLFTFYDRGYSALLEGIKNLRNMSAALLVMGLIAALLLTLQIAHIYITKQKEKLAVERLLGMTGKKCRSLSLAGIFILLLLGTVPGAAVGTALAGQIHVEDMQQEEFNRKYSNLGLAVETEIDLNGQGQDDGTVPWMMGGLVILLGMGICTFREKEMLKDEPLYLLEEGAAGK